MSKNHRFYCKRTVRYCFGPFVAENQQFYSRFFSPISRRYVWDVTKNWSRFPTSRPQIRDEIVEKVIKSGWSRTSIPTDISTTSETVSPWMGRLEVGNRLQMFVTSQTCRLLIREKNLDKKYCFSTTNGPKEYRSRIIISTLFFLNKKVSRGWVLQKVFKGGTMLPAPPAKILKIWAPKPLIFL